MLGQNEISIPNLCVFASDSRSKEAHMLFPLLIMKARDNAYKFTLVLNMTISISGFSSVGILFSRVYMLILWVIRCRISNYTQSISCNVITYLQRIHMMTSSNGNIFRVTGPLCREFTGPGEFPTQRPVTRSFDVFFDLRLNKWLSKQPWSWWFETLSWSLWRQCNELLAAQAFRNVRTSKLHDIIYHPPGEHNSFAIKFNLHHLTNMHAVNTCCGVICAAMSCDQILLQSHDRKVWSELAAEMGAACVRYICGRQKRFFAQLPHSADHKQINIVSTY